MELELRFGSWQVIKNWHLQVHPDNLESAVIKATQWTLSNKQDTPIILWNINILQKVINELFTTHKPANP